VNNTKVLALQKNLERLDKVCKLVFFKHILVCILLMTFEPSYTVIMKLIFAYGLQGIL